MQLGKERTAHPKGKGRCALPACPLHTRVLVLHSILTLLQKTHPLPSMYHIADISCSLLTIRSNKLP